MSQRSRLGARRVSAAAAVLALLPVAGASAAGRFAPETGARISVCLSDQAHVDEAIVEPAREMVTRIFQRAGVEIAWVDQSTASTERHMCGVPEGANEVAVRIVRRPGVAPHMGRSRAGGMALRPTSWATSGLVSVFYDCVQSTAAETRISPAVVLGVLMAHEIGHLFLPPGHANRGIMRPSLGLGDLILASQGLVLFDDKESKAILARLRGDTDQPRSRATKPGRLSLNGPPTHGPGREW
jgi:hypothetical protein